MITPQLILALNPRHPNAPVAAAKLQLATVAAGIVSPRQVAMLLSQLAHESLLVPQEENLSYRASRICQVWPGRFPTLESAQPYAFNPQALGNRVYDGRMGNAPGTGFKNRGRGQLQITGHDNLVTYERLTGFPLSTQPDLLLQYGVSSVVACSFWTAHGLNAPAERGDVVAVTRAINGGVTGLDDRERLYQRALTHVPRLGLLETDPPLDLAGDLAADLDRRHEAYTQALSLLTA
jgi:putative chitinase